MYVRCLFHGMEISFQISFSSCRNKSPRERGKFVAGRDDSATKDNKSIETVTVNSRPNWKQDQKIKIKLRDILLRFGDAR